ncbi:MAG: hypothetical protein IKM91_09655 [Candidatus Methanomethylophilaceae archaeon]|nr:hypothetical protein [Candidatus Methanomethylophilaceae archaeon]MBR6871855.1 hypothetical protein [Candidatus Methanomethylophilaceae archaeon]
MKVVFRDKNLSTDWKVLSAKVPERLFDSVDEYRQRKGMKTRSAAIECLLAKALLADGVADSGMCIDIICFCEGASHGGGE